ncbi:MAG: acyl-CoA dehydrogenase C-terminal domain-containing protein, partial [Pseudomonas sp.]
YPYRAAGDFLQLCATSLLAFAWARAARCVQGLAEDDPVRAVKLESARFCFDYLLTEVDRQIAAVRAAQAPLPFVQALG